MRRLHGMQRLIVLSVAVSAALASAPRVICTNTNPAVLGGDVTLTCDFQAHLDVLQVTWQKKRGKDTQNMVTCSEKYGINIAKPFEKHITVLNTSSVTSSIRISKLEKEDEACYNCLFNAYPNGAFTGGVCLNDLHRINEVLCNAQGNDLRIELLPPEIRMRQSVQLTKRKMDVPDVFTVKGQYTDTNINPECTFQLEQAKRKRRNTQKSEIHPVEDADGMVFIQCTASGTTKFMITWHNEGQPDGQEDTVNRTGNITTVTSTLVYKVSSFPADNRMSCSISHGPQPEAEPGKTGVKEYSKADAAKDDSEQHGAPQNRFRAWHAIIFGAFSLSSLILILAVWKTWRKTEAKTPRKVNEDKNGHITPVKVPIEDDSGTAMLSAPINEATPSATDQAKPKEAPCSSLKKRKVRTAEKPNGARKILPFSR